MPSSPALEPQQRRLVLTSRKDLKVLKVMEQFPPFLEEPTTHPMEMETAHGEGLLSCDTQATDICCPDIMSAKLSNVECFLNPTRVEFHIQKSPLKRPKLSSTNFLAY